jgi:integrase
VSPFHRLPAVTDRYPEGLIQVQVGHECDSSTAIYTHVSDDFMNTMLKKALSPVFDPPAPLDKEP